MEMLGEVRRMRLRDKLSLHEISKRTGLWRNRLRKWLRKPEDTAPPRYRRVQMPTKLSEFHVVARGSAEQLLEWKWPQLKLTG